MSVDDGEDRRGVFWHQAEGELVFGYVENAFGNVEFSVCLKRRKFRRIRLWRGLRKR